MSADDSSGGIGSGRIREVVTAMFGGGASALGYDLFANPDAFVLAVVWDAIVSAAASTAGAIGAKAIEIFAILESATVGTIGDVVGSVAGLVAQLIVDDLIGGVDGVVVDVAAAAGPFSTLALIVIWGLLLLLVGAGLLGAWRLYLLIRSAIV